MKIVYDEASSVQLDQIVPPKKSSFFLQLTFLSFYIL